MLCHQGYRQGDLRAGGPVAAAARNRHLAHERLPRAVVAAVPRHLRREPGEQHRLLRVPLPVLLHRRLQRPEVSPPRRLVERRQIELRLRRLLDDH
ncbi:MAG: hypothetical protein LC779_11800 [Actinobacteria bacterium]|nr:hypothetical protein [Actinomycetota bacterium]